MHLRCECGTEVERRANSVLAGEVRSCGCLRVETTRATHTKHGGYADQQISPTMATYKGMIARCTRPSHVKYADYGGRGIKICDRWLEPDGRGFANFVADMGERPVDPRGQGRGGLLTLDRIDVNGDYTPENCRWADWSTQCANQRRWLDKPDPGERERTLAQLVETGEATWAELVESGDVSEDELVFADQPLACPF